MFRGATALLLTLVISGCVADTPAPRMAAGKSAVYGIVSARAHKEVLAKWATSSVPSGYGNAPVSGSAAPTGTIDYGNLSEIYVTLIDAKHQGGARREITFSDHGSEPESLALAIGDIVRVRNRTAAPLTFFLSELDGDGFQEFAIAPAGGSAEIKVRIEGSLELGTDENERLTAPVFAKKGLRVRRIGSGERYSFENLDPGDYNMIFWYWRLGSLERSVTLSAGKSLRLDEVLAVDRTVR